MHYSKIFIHFIIALWNISAIRTYYFLDRRDHLQTGRTFVSIMELTTKTNKMSKYYESEDFSSEFSSRNILNGHFQERKVILPVLNTARPIYNNLLRMMTRNHTMKTDIMTEKINTEVLEKSYSPIRKNRFQKANVKQYLTFEEFIKKLAFNTARRKYIDPVGRMGTRRKLEVDETKKKLKQNTKEKLNTSNQKDQTKKPKAKKRLTLKEIIRKLGMVMQYNKTNYK